MNELVSMLVPLETLGGTWPAVENPPVLTSLGLLVGLPALAFLIIYGIAHIGSLSSAGRGDDDLDTSSATWVGSAPEDQGPRRALGPGESGSGTGSSSTDGGTGGAGARW